MHDATALVSIIVPAYKADEFLPAALSHIARQSYTEWELIVVEDASTGATEQIVADFAARHPLHRVVYRRHEVNQGVAATRNTAISMAHGAFIALLDADDLWQPDHLAASVAALQGDHVDITHSPVVVFDYETGHILSLWGPSPRERAQFPHGLFARNFVTPSSTVMRREVVEKVGPFDVTPELQGCEDLDYWLRCVQAKVRFLCIAGCHCLYRQGHPGAATSQAARILRRRALVLEKHLGMAEIPLWEQRWQLAKCYWVNVRVGLGNGSMSVVEALRMFFRGCRHLPWSLRVVAPACFVVFSGMAGLGLATLKSVVGNRS